MIDDYIDSHYDGILEHELDIESRMIAADCTKEELKQCNRWFISVFGEAGEKVVLIDDGFESVLTRLIS